MPTLLNSDLPSDTQTTIEEKDRIQFDAQGFIILRGVLNHHEIETIKEDLGHLEGKDFDDSWMKNEKGMPTRSRSGEALRLNGLPRISEHFDFLIGHPRVQPFLDEFMMDPMLVNTWYINKKKGNGDIGWHSGLNSWEHHAYNGKVFANMVNTIWALDDNNPDTGCPMVLPGSHKRSFDYSTSFKGLEMPGSIPVILTPGDILIFSEATLHGGLPHRSEGQRRNVYINHIGHRHLFPLEDGNLHHYFLPKNVRSRFPQEKQRLFRWMKHFNVVES
jgi:hypothetical protein